MYLIEFMKQIRILIPLHVMPTEKHITTMLFENLLPALRTKANVSVFWLVYLPKKLVSFEIPNELGTVIDIHNFKNFVEVIEHVKPDIIYENELKFSLGEDIIKHEEPQSDDSIIVVAIIAIVSIGAAIFYLKGYKK